MWTYIIIYSVVVHSLDGLYVDLSNNIICRCPQSGWPLCGPICAQKVQHNPEVLVPAQEYLVNLNIKRTNNNDRIFSNAIKKVYSSKKILFLMKHYNINYVISKFQSLKYQRFTPSVIAVQNLEFVVYFQFL